MRSLAFSALVVACAACRSMALPVAAASGDPPAPKAALARGLDEAERALDLVAIDGGRLYHLDPAAGLLVYAIDDPARPRRLGRHALTGRPLGLAVRDGIATLVLREHEPPFSVGHDLERPGLLRAVDVRDPAHARILGESPLPGDVRDARATAGVVRVLSETRDAAGPHVVITVVHLDGSDAASPRRLRLDGSAGALRGVTGGFALAYADARGPGTHVDMVAESPGRDPRVTGSVALDASLGYGERETSERMDAPDAAHVRVLACRTVVCSEGDTLELVSVDASNAGHPRVASTRTIRSPGMSMSTRFDGNRLYLARRDGLAPSAGGRSTPVLVVDLAEQADVSAQVAVEGGVWDIVPLGQRAVVVGLREEPESLRPHLFVQALDVRDPQHPAVAGESLIGASDAAPAALHTRFAVASVGEVLALPFRPAGARTEAPSGVTMLELTPGGLRRMGDVAVDARIERLLFVGRHLLAVTDAGVWSIDADLLRTPYVSRVELSAR